jgi:hypothetical protein
MYVWLGLSVAWIVQVQFALVIKDTLSLMSVSEHLITTAYVSRISGHCRSVALLVISPAYTLLAYLACLFVSESEKMQKLVLSSRVFFTAHLITNKINHNFIGGTNRGRDNITHR